MSSGTHASAAQTDFGKSKSLFDLLVLGLKLKCLAQLNSSLPIALEGVKSHALAEKCLGKVGLELEGLICGLNSLRVVSKLKACKCKVRPEDRLKLGGLWHNIKSFGVVNASLGIITLCERFIATNLLELGDTFLRLKSIAIPGSLSSINLSLRKRHVSARAEDTLSHELAILDMRNKLDFSRALSIMLMCAQLHKADLLTGHMSLRVVNVHGGVLDTCVENLMFSGPENARSVTNLEVLTEIGLEDVVDSPEVDLAVRTVGHLNVAGDSNSFDVEGTVLAVLNENLDKFGERLRESKGTAFNTLEVDDTLVADFAVINNNLLVIVALIKDMAHGSLGELALIPSLFGLAQGFKLLAIAFLSLGLGLILVQAECL
mmetsp:Transcript_17176/g.33675  ORF Transcript_17176/g.33675 Transcript_17176/m.33675 type:complete len:375 (-) Transcript_17176:376-1500(-)